MQINKLKIANYGPFKFYEIIFPLDKCSLLTGRNNEGKSSIINAIRLVSYATKVINKSQQRLIIEHNQYYRLLKQDVEKINVERLIYNYQDIVAEISAFFDCGIIIKVYINPFERDIYASYEGKYDSNIISYFGFVPPLGPLNETEEIIMKTAYLKANVFTSLAPRHTRNYLYQLLTEEENLLVKQIFNESWESAELLDYEIDYSLNQINLFFRENGIDREISWAGQGLQIWLQIIIHIVLNRHASFLVLDEPEVNLHPEKQHDLLKIVQEYFKGKVLIATHSVEMIDSVDVNNIIFIEKAKYSPIIKSTKNREFLNQVRRKIGSNFNLIVSQFDNHDLILFTEDKDDYKVYMKLMEKYNIKKSVLPIPINGFQNYKKCIYYYEVYNMLMGNDANAILILDRDYYPEEYLNDLISDLIAHKIRVIFTPCKEMENLFIEYNYLCELAECNSDVGFKDFYNDMQDELYLDAYANMISRHKAYYKKLDEKKIIKDFSKPFNNRWKTEVGRDELIQGKVVLSKIREYAQIKKWNVNLTFEFLIKNNNSSNIRKFIMHVFE